MKFPVLILIVVVFTAEAFAQSVQSTPPKIAQQTLAEPCSVKLSDLPTLRGFRLGMTKSQVQKEYPSMKITTDRIISSGFMFGYQIDNPDYAVNIDRIVVAFRNEKVFSVLLTYTDTVNWDSAEEFADKISKSLNLPKARERKGTGGVFYSVNCRTFLVRTRINSQKQPILFLTTDPNEMWETTQQKKDAFKP